ncbi:MAG: PAS domain S-box protein, partial [Myxococcales bacterium]
MADLDYALVLDAFADAVIASDSSDRVIYANAAVQALLGWSPAELVGRPLTTLMPERMHAAHEAGYRRFITTHQARIIGRPVRVPALHRDGHEVDVELTLTAFRPVGGGDLIVASLRSLANRIELEQKLEEQRRVLVQWEVMRLLSEVDGSGPLAP